MPNYRKKGGVRVRCLGPGKEHTFLSEDATRNRVCPKCRVWLNQHWAPMVEHSAIDDDGRVFRGQGGAM
jgi:hypothetical protein